MATLRYWYESTSRTPNRDGSHPLDLPVSSIVRKRALRSTSMPALHRRIMPNCRPMADGGMRECSAGACPPLGSGWGVAESAVPSHNSGFPYLGVPAAAGMSDWYEDALKRLSSAPARPSIRHSREERAPYPDTWRESRGWCGNPAIHQGSSSAHAIVSSGPAPTSSGATRGTPSRIHPSASDSPPGR